jgi:DNA-binding MarR family transcriptional regulator
VTNPPILTSRNIGETENALRAILIKTLSGTGLDYHRWVALKAASEGQAPISRSELAKQLKGGLKINDATADEVIDDLQEHNIFDRAGDNLSPTPHGRSLYQRLNGEISQQSQQIYAGLDADDLAAAYRVLSTITERANALLE